MICLYLSNERKWGSGVAAKSRDEAGLARQPTVCIIRSQHCLDPASAPCTCKSKSQKSKQDKNRKAMS